MLFVFMLYNVYVYLHFAAMCDNFHRTVISHSLLWKSIHFGVIFSIHDAKSVHSVGLLQLILWQGWQELGRNTIPDFPWDFPD